MDHTDLKQKNIEPENIYFALPRFVCGSDKGDSEGYLPSINRKFIRNDREFSLVIRPAALSDERGKLSWHYPSEEAEQVELALRKLAVAENTNFQENNLSLHFSVAELLEKLPASFGGLDKSAEINKQIDILASVGYVLSDESSKVAFRPINSFQKQVKDGETYYTVNFDRIFLA